MMFLFKWLATDMDYTDSLLVAMAKLCRLLLQLRDEVKWLPHPSSDEFLIRMEDNGWIVCRFKFKVHTYWKQLATYQCLTFQLKNRPTRGVAAILFNFLTRVRAYMVLPSPG